ncbi:DUF4360 domain-containing protein [Polyangium spumosum]|uniref:DUF4360 domain-containing protein n=1 Tax=Polyangium spumosum TaxID=889282 RepID=A0A6N7PQA1_9BACT|nr:DUF4360 domain-containing protein [Polyangium spumosum]MRG94382.1 DUF4360 domain-containing protein [Polyangium spumosum]
MKKTLARVLFGLGLSALVAPSAAEAQAPPRASIRSITALGTGCPSGSVTAILTQDLGMLVFVNGALSVEAGPGVSPSEQRVFCQVMIDLDHTPGYSYAVSSAYGYRGYAELDAGVTATLDVERYFTGELGTNPVQSTLRGPFAARFHVREPPEAVGPFSPCGASRPLNIRTALNVSTIGNPGASGRVRLTPMWGAQHLQLHWRRCS